MNFLSTEEILRGNKIAIDDIVSCNNSNYIVREDIQNCSICPFNNHCDVIDCGGGFDKAFEPLSEIESLILLGGIRGRR